MVSCQRGQEMVLDPLGLEIQAVVSGPMWGWENELKPSAAAAALSQRHLCSSQLQPETLREDKRASEGNSVDNFTFPWYPAPHIFFPPPLALPWVVVSS